MHVLNRLHKYARRLQKLAGSDFFSPELQNVARKLTRVCLNTIKYASEFHEYDLNGFQYAVSRVCLHLEGSTKSELPYVIDNCISRTIKNWCGMENFTVAHAFTDIDNEFYIDPNSWYTVLDFAHALNPKLNLIEHLVLIGVPRVFKNTALFSASLYHEVGHFVDLTLGISSGTFGDEEQNIASSFSNFNRCAEFFADMYAANYIGDTAADVLDILVPNHPETKSHPSTAQRIESIRKFCRGEEFKPLREIQSFLKDNNLNLLEQRFTVPNIVSCFDDGRPYDIKNLQELHGMWSATWEYVKDLEAGRDPGWPSEFSHFDKVQIANDLLEKSISNFMITEDRKKLGKIKDLLSMKISPLLESKQIGDSSVDLRLGLNFLVPLQSLNLPIENVSDEDGCDSISQHFHPKRRDLDERFLLKPNQVVLAVSLEHLAMPDDVNGEVHIHKSFADRGISFRTKIASGYRGSVPIELINRGNEPVEITVGSKMFRMAVEKTARRTTHASANSKHFALVKPDLRKLSDNTTLEQLQEFI